MYKRAVHTYIKGCTGSRCTYCGHGLATDQAVSHPARPVSRITPLETSKLVKKDRMLGDRMVGDRMLGDRILDGIRNRHQLRQVRQHRTVANGIG